MFIPLVECANCGEKGRPGSDFGTSSDASSFQLHCNCGNTFELPNPKDQCVLSSNPFVRFDALSNHHESGTIPVMLGRCAQVTFARAFDYPCRAFLTPRGTTLIFAKAAYLDKVGMTILAGRQTDESGITSEILVSWSVYGLVEMDALPAWYVQFYAAATHLANGLFKPALLEYAVAFELFLENYLRSRLEARFGTDCAKLILRKSWRVEDRCKDILELVVGHKMSERNDVYQPWDTDVRKPRNRLAHGEIFSVGQAEAENAHQASYQAIRWVESL